MFATSPVTVGREAELRLMEEALADLRRSAGRSVFLSGETGLGKSRLARECADRAGRLGVPVLRGRGSSTGLAAPFRPLVEALASRSRLGGLPTGPELDPYRPALARLVPEWRRVGEPGYPESLVELAEALLRLLAVLGRESGCLLLLEDLHAADSETLTVIDYLVDNLAGLPVLLVATLRPEPGAAVELVRAAERRRVTSVAVLEPFAGPEVRAVAAGCLGVAADRVPGGVVELLVHGSGGNPYLVEELLADLVGSGALRSGPGGRLVLEGPTVGVPAAVVRSHGNRIARLEPAVRELLLTAASLGERFSVSTLRLVVGGDDRVLFARLRIATEAGFVVPADGDPDQYAFRHALTAEALLATASPPERAAVARRTAAELERSDPELSEERCRLVADLWVAAGEPGRAALRYAEAGRRAQAGGAAVSAVVLLERAAELAAEPDRAEIVESLLPALAEAGRLDRALELAGTLPPPVPESAAVDRRVELHTRLAWFAVMAERVADTAAQVAAARALLLGPGPRRTAVPERSAALTVIEAHLTLLPASAGAGGPGAAGAGPGAGAGAEVVPVPVAESERLAREAAELAERAPLPVLACQAWHLLALLSREHGFDRADECLERMLAVAERHALPVWRVEALVRLGVNSFMRTGSSASLQHAREVAGTLGAILLTQSTDSLLAMQAVLHADPPTAREIIDRCLDTSARLRDFPTHRYLLLASATLAAHHGRRREMERELVRFARAGGTDSFLVPVVLGLCRGFCALLEEDRPAAVAELASVAAWEAEHPNVFYLSGSHGLRPLLDVLAGGAGRAEHEARAAAPAGALAWNRQFLLLADAVLLGREGRPEQAVRALEAVGAGYAQLFPTAYHLGLRLVAEAALADGWGEPVAWLRTAEEYFHRLGVPSVAGACRALLRRAGASVAQHRSGRDRIPPVLRGLGVTLREYEVLALLVERPGNQEIARRLSISPRTVEKHIANLARKTGRPDRAALGGLARELAHEAGPER